MADLTTLGRAELEETLRALRERYQEYASKGLALDMTRGKPSSAQLDLSLALLELPGRSDYRTVDGVDCRNYGVMEGIPEARALFGQYLELAPEQVIVGGNSSLTLMHDAIVRALLHGVPDGDGAWSKQPATRFLCPSPGYDRHFAICEEFGIGMIAVDMNEHGPDMDQVERLAAGDPSIKGIWCVPRYSNPTGVTYSRDTVERLAGMRTAASDFRILWDNAYAVHHLTDDPEPLAHILRACEAAGHPNRALLFASTSKITLAGAGLAAMGASPENIEDAKRHLAKQIIGPDKVNQLRHVRMFRSLDDIRAHMRRHASLVRPKFDAVLEVFERELGGKNVAAWSRPKGGYFVSLDSMDGCAKEVVGLAADAGVKLTQAGATFPYGRDPRNRNIRIAPTFPDLEDIEIAMQVVAVCVQIAGVRKLLG
ncbi:MAG: aminotransferase class I/II-fold pyridoxal phosphate-dependent enzyme [Gammaproteobacteria bacterium]|nr:aminotransferase class I/II-fold pyridoxal phosphate-dependent enzyme [Gammaproteobacteria bacterium]NIR83319.1 aminotransferase class I/II-fold pyridoxal phosphate-dependent enzyme [Gammaproteobacteria bacterium]NIR91119.1 aminotransferase class I/II-fold pyridoxal phosphate-dependent enzyme [Gammaproteobacteria bacterium]NIU04486.1 aminotransferase class I/II-fold pyridoxal phosphate-dependent enzyme [Gammaproteobacteria bacterium]NIW87122.1 aminotransferase class I/II-fold pyridoxal phosp